jgi:uroporphyrinogen-III synthase
MGLAEAIRAACRERTVAAPIGPVTSEALHAYGLEPDVRPEHPRMGHLVAAVAQRATELLRQKRSTPS